MKYKVIILALLLVSSTSTIGLFFYPRAKAEVIEKVGAWALVTPIIDGAMAPGEWDDASVLTFDLTTLGDLHQTSVYVKNDASNLYMAVILRNDDYNSRDEFLVAFDDDNNGSIEDGEDAWHRMVVPEPPWGWGDAYSHWMSGTIYYSPDISDGGTDDLISAATHTNTSGMGDYTFEFSHPLNTTDTAHDFSLFPGSTVGFGVDFSDYAGDLSWYGGDYPDGFAYTGNFIELDIASPPKTIWVPDNFTSIQEAINNASNGDTIQVRAGTYYEHLAVNKTVSLVGENRDTTIIDGNGTGNVINVTTNNVHISGFTVRNSGHAFPGSGIRVDGSIGNNISHNIITNNYYGIIIRYSSNNALTGNNALNNEYNFGVWGDNFFHYNNYIDISNTVDSKPIYYLIGVANATYDAKSNAGTIYLINCNNITIRDLTLTKNGKGVFLWNMTDSRIENVTTSNNEWGIVLDHSCNNILTSNTVSNNHEGIRVLWDSNNNILTGNTASSNIFDGIRLHHSSNNNLIDNTASNNSIGIVVSYFSNGNILTGNDIYLNYHGIFLSYSGNNIFTGNNVSLNYPYGIGLLACSNNVFFHNNFIDNTNQTESWLAVGINTWDNGVEGNYWSDYDGADSDQDGIGDTPYIIDGNNTDNYPLMGMFYDFPVTWGEETYHVQVISNSTVSNLYAAIWLSSPTEYLSPGDTFIHFNVFGEEGTGFCRVTIPRALLNDSYIVLVDWNEVPVKELPISNATHAFLYFTYLHPEHEVIIVPEFSSALIPPLLLIITIIAVIAAKRTLISRVIKKERTRHI